MFTYVLLKTITSVTIINLNRYHMYRYFFNNKNLLWQRIYLSPNLKDNNCYEPLLSSQSFDTLRFLISSANKSFSPDKYTWWRWLVRIYPTEFCPMIWDLGVFWVRPCQKPLVIWVSPSRKFSVLSIPGNFPETPLRSFGYIPKILSFTAKRKWPC